MGNTVLKDDLVSIIVPVYNERRYLNDCIISIVNQTYKNIEIIMVDDGSTDGTAEDCDVLAQKYDRVSVIHKSNSGYSDSIYEGLLRSHGEWIMISDDDDVYHRTLVEVLMNHRSEDVDIVAGGRIDSTDIDSAINEIDSYSGTVEFFIDTGKNICEMIPRDKQKSIITPPWGKIYRTEFLRKLDLKKYADVVPTNYLEDVFATPLLYCNARNICIVKRPLYIHREVPTSLSRSGKLNNFYYDQIPGGNILLKYFKSHNMTEMYNYELVIYIRTILRIRCLDDNKEREIQIRKFFNYYKKDYFACKTIPTVERLSARLYSISPRLWRVIAKRYYWNRKNR